MKVNQWTLGLAAAGLVSLPVVMQAEEASQHVLTMLSSTTISGFVDTSAQWNLGSGNARNASIPYNGSSKADGFNLNYVQLTIQKPLDAQDNWASGYRVDLGYGPDLASWGTVSGNSGIKQAYVALRAPLGNGLDLKMGVFDTIIGYETFERVNNPHYTHSYGNGIEPTSHTGLLASYQLTEHVGVSAGIANSTSPVINNRVFNGANSSPGHAESYKTYMASVTLKAPDSWGALAGSALYAGVINGAGDLVKNARQNYYVGATINSPWSGVKFGVAYDYLGSKKDSGRDPLGPLTSLQSGHADAVSIYSSIKISDKMSFLARGEHFERSGATTASTGGGNPTRVLAGTGTLQYDLWANVISRLELRWDHQAGGTPLAYGNSAGKRNDFLLAANVIYKF